MIMKRGCQSSRSRTKQIRCQNKQGKLSRKEEKPTLSPLPPKDKDLRKQLNEEFQRAVRTDEKQYENDISTDIEDGNCR